MKIRSAAPGTWEFLSPVISKASKWLHWTLLPLKVDMLNKKLSPIEESRDIERYLLESRKFQFYRQR